MVFDNKGKLAPAIVNALCKDYFTSMLVDVEEDSYNVLQFAPWMKKYPSEGVFSVFVDEYVKDYVTGVSRHELWDALSLSEIHQTFDCIVGRKKMILHLIWITLH